MTAREILDKHFKDNLPSKWNGEMWDKRIIDAMEEYANQQLLLAGIGNQRELLIAYENMLLNAGYMTVKNNDQDRDDFIKGFNCT